MWYHHSMVHVAQSLFLSQDKKEMNMFPRRFFTLVIVLITLLNVACQPTPPPATPTPIAITASPTPENSIRLASGEWPPYLSESLPNQGFAAQIVTEAFALEGITVEYGYFPWARSFDISKRGDWDGTLIWSPTPERLVDFYASDTVITSEDVFFHLKNVPFDYNEMADLAGLQIGATLEYDYGPEFQQAEADGLLQVERTSSDELNFRKLLAGRIDVFPLDLDVGLAMLNEYFTPEEIAQVTYHPKPYRTTSYGVLLSKEVPRNVEMLNLLNAGLKKLRESGRMQQIIDEARQIK
jgi:polar amino acid transport system substrate-binding protein